MTKSPLVSVLMTVYNGEPYLATAMESILTQTFQDFEFIIIDNTSTDNSREIVSSFMDSRIRFVANPINAGQTRALNQGLQLARGRYVARIDADDVSLPERLTRQLDFLIHNPRYAVLGTQVRFIDHRGKTLYTPWLPVTPEEIRWRLLFGSPVGHSSVMMRRDIVLNMGGYNENLRYVQDYALWSELASKGHQIANLIEPLALFRVHGCATSIVAARSEWVREVSMVSQRNVQEFLGLPVTRSDMETVCRLLSPHDLCPPEQVSHALDVIDSIAKAFGKEARVFYGRTLVRLAVSPGSISSVQRAALLLKGLYLIGSQINGQGVYRFLREWILTGRFIRAVWFARRRSFY